MAAIDAVQHKAIVFNLEEAQYVMQQLASDNWKVFAINEETMEVRQIKSCHEATEFYKPNPCFNCGSMNAARTTSRFCKDCLSDGI